MPIRLTPTRTPTAIVLGLLVFLSGCSYPEIVESIRTGPLPKLERVESIKVSQKLLLRFPIGTETDEAIQSLEDAGFRFERTYPKRYLMLNSLDVVWRGYRKFRTDGDKFAIRISIDSRSGSITGIRALVKKYFF